VHPDVAALLAVQDDDLAIDKREADLAQLKPRLDALAADCQRAERGVQEVEQLIQAEEKRRRDVEERIAHHRQLRDRHESVMNTITNQREAAAASAQLEQAKKFIAEDERELGTIAQRMSELKLLAEERAESLAQANRARDEAEGSLGADRDRLQAEIGTLRAQRDQKAVAVPRPVLGKYDRIRSKRRVSVVHALRGNSCSHCDTTLPMQRRTQMSGTGATEICEGCGMLLYASE
jgi:predicted  nucleic acid-binding Zn-ribbon protein